VGVLPNLDDASIKIKARLEPGKMFLVDLHKGEIIPDDIVKVSETHNFFLFICYCSLMSVPATVQLGGSRGAAL
jgi:Glutamine amidotransferases class-II